MSTFDQNLSALLRSFFNSRSILNDIRPSLAAATQRTQA